MISEQKVYRLNQIINDRGVTIDKQLCNSAISVCEKRKQELAKECRQLTNLTPGQVGELVRWLGVKSLTKDKFDEYEHEFTGDRKRVVQIRRAFAKTSTAKFQRMLEMVSADGRLRGMYRYHGAGPGRFQSMGVNLANLPRPTEDPEIVIPEILRGDVRSCEPMEACASAIRGAFVPREGFKLVAGDWGQIEARLTAYLAGQEDVVAAFAGGRDPYVEEAAKFYGKPADAVTGTERNVGKTQVLALGFGGGAGAFTSMAKTLRVTLPPDLDPKLAVHQWRENNQFIVRWWHYLYNAAISAVLSKTRETFTVKSSEAATCYVVSGEHLWCRLPSGRLICYPFPELVMAAWTKTEHGPRKVISANMTPEQREQKQSADYPNLTCMGVDPYTKQWTRVLLSPGRMAENVVQGSARDVLVPALIRLENYTGLDTVIHTYDEPVCESPAEKAEQNEQQLAEIMTTPVDWAPDLPLACDTYTADRYRK